jgi:hypothetical protein
MHKPSKPYIETVDLRVPAFLEPQGRLPNLCQYYAHVTRKAGNLFFQNRVHAKLIPYAMHFVRVLDLGDTPILIRRGASSLNPGFTRESVSTGGGRTISVVFGSFGVTFAPSNSPMSGEEMIRSIVYQRRLRWADYVIEGTDHQAAYCPAIISTLAHELLHVKHPDETEDRIRALTLPFLMSCTDVKETFLVRQGQE